MYCPSNINRVITSEIDRACGTYRWAGRGHTGFWWTLKERDHFEHLDIDGKRIILNVNLIDRNRLGGHELD